MKRFSGFVKKEFFHIFRDKRTMLILFGIPIAQILIFGYVVTNEIKDADIAILDHSKDDITREITSNLLASGYFRLAALLSSEAQIEDVFLQSKAKQVIVFEPGFAEKITRTGSADIQIIADASDANTANLLVNFSSSVIHGYSNQFMKSSGLQMQIIPEVRMMFNENLEGAYMFVPGTMALILILVSAMMTSLSIAREKEMGTMEILLVSPLKPIQIIIGKVMPYIGIAFINSIVIILMGIFVFGMPVKGSATLLVLESLLFIIMSLSLGILISTMANSQQVAMFVSMFALMLPVMLLSGFIFPVENMPKILQWVSYVIPAKYFIVIIKNVMLKGTGLLFIWKETLILIGMTVLFISLSIKKFNVRLQ